MIRQLRLNNFKCFHDLTLDMGPLTLLAGLNGMGKSSVLQSLLLLRQSSQDSRSRPRVAADLILNGDLIHLGTGRDVLYADADRDEFVIGIAYGDHNGVANLVLTAQARAEADVLALRHELIQPEVRPGRRTPILPLPEFLTGRFQYLQAERIGPRLAYGTSDYVVRQQRQVGSQGEYSVHFLARYGDQDIANPQLTHPNAKSLSLLNQVEAWMDEVSPGTRLRVSAVPDLDLVGLRFSFVTGKEESDYFRATNVGFGLSYTLPVLVAALAAKPGALLLIENPEAHLHPRGQAMIGDMLARVAAAGVQVIVETHSDHVLNGIRLAVHGGRIAPEDVQLHYFERRLVEDRAEHVALSPRIDRNGRIDRWPEGFFDEWDRSLEALLEPRAK